MEKSPDAFRTISEVAEWLDVPTHVLRFWESRFAQVKPVKRAGGRRYYRPSDMQLIGGIKKLLHEDGMTIRGVQKLLREEGVRHVASFSQPLEHEADELVEEAHVEDVSGMAASQGGVVSIVTEQSTPEAPEPSAEETEPGTVVTFGSVRERAPEPELPLGGAPGHAEPAHESDAPAELEAAPNSNETEVAESSEAPEAMPAISEEEEERILRLAEEAVAEVVAEVMADALTKEPAAPAIPSTPEVPETDPEDEDPRHSGAPGRAARFAMRDRSAGPLPGIRIEEVVDRLRDLRERVSR